MNYMYTDDSYYLFKHEIINGKYDIYYVFKYYINYHILTSLIRGLMFFSQYQIRVNFEVCLFTNVQNVGTCG